MGAKRRASNRLRVCAMKRPTIEHQLERAREREREAKIIPNVRQDKTGDQSVKADILFDGEIRARQTRLKGHFLLENMDRAEDADRW